MHSNKRRAGLEIPSLTSYSNTEANISSINHLVTYRIPDPFDLEGCVGIVSPAKERRRLRWTII